MNRLRKIVRSALSAVLIAGVVLSSSAIAPMTVTPAEAIAPFTIVKKGFGALGSLASAVGPTIVGKILNATGNTELANFFGLNTNMNLMTVMKDVQEIQTELGTISDQVTDLSNQLDNAVMGINTWTTLTNFVGDYGPLATKSSSSLKKLAQIESNYNTGRYTQDVYEREVANVMSEIYDNRAFFDDIYAMGSAIMGENTSIISPTKAYYQFAMQVNETTRDQLLEKYIAFSTKTYQDYVLAVMLCNGAMAYMTEQGTGMYEIDIQTLSQQSQQVLRYLTNEREELFPNDRVSQRGANVTDLVYVDVPDAHLTANDYVVTYKNGKVAEAGFEKKTATNELQLSEYYLTLEVGEASAIKVFKDGQHYGEWTSSDETVAVVDEFGGVFATGVGTAELTVKYDNEELSVQVDVVDVSSDSTSITTKTGEVKEINGTGYVALSELMPEAGISGVNPDAYTWITTDPNGVTVNNGIVTGAGKSGGYSMVIGTRQVRYDTNGGSYYEIEKVVFPFKTAYDENGAVYDYDDLLNADIKDGAKTTLENNLTTDTAYGQIMADTKLNPGLSQMEINGQGHTIDLAGVPLMGDMTDSTVSNLALISCYTMDSAAVVDKLPTSGTIENCDINLTIEGNRQYLGGAANESQGKIDGVNFFGNVTNTYVGTSGGGQIKGKHENCSIIPQEGTFSVENDKSNDSSEAVQIATGTGGIVGRQDVNATYTSGRWARTDDETGIYNCYGSGSVTGDCNVGGIVGLAVGDWTNSNSASISVWSTIDGGGSADTNAAYVRVYASVSDGEVTATASDGSGIAGGVVGYSVMAEIKGASVSATVQQENANKDTNQKGRIAGISGIYLPAYTRDNGAEAGQINVYFFNKGEGFKMEGVFVESSNIKQDGTGDIEPYCYIRKIGAYVNFKGHDFNEDKLKKASEYSLNSGIKGQILAAFLDSIINSVNTEISSEVTGVMKSNDKESINKGMPIFDTTRVSSNNKTNYAFDMEDSYTYGDPITPANAEGVVSITYSNDSGDMTDDVLDAGTYTATATFVDGSTERDTFEVTQRKVSLADPSEDQLKLAYTGNQRTVSSPYVTNALPGDKVEVTVKEGTNIGTEIHEYTLEVEDLTGDDAANYKLDGNYTMPWWIVKSEDTDADALVEKIDTNLTGAMNSAGGNLSLTLTGENLDNDVFVGLFDGNALKSSGEVIQVGNKWTSTLDVPANNTDKDKTYSLMVSYDGGKSWKEIPGTKDITVAGKGSSSDAAIQQIAIDHSNLNHAGGAVIVTVTGQNLASAPYVGLFDGNELLDKSVTKSNGDSYVAVLDVPANTVAETLSYSVRVSENGSTWLSTPVNYLTIAGDPNAEASEGDDHAVFVNTNDYGWLNVEPHRAEKGEKVVITVTPADGCELDEITLMDEQGYIMAAVAIGPNQYSFTMPETAVSVAATFVQSSGHPSDSELPFYDVRTTDWFYEAVKFVYDENLMTGTGANAFSPNATTTRGMIVSILARLEGVTSAQSAGFADVNAGDWYATAVNWAANVGVVNGYEDGTFRPNTAITREQLAAILMNYASYKGENVSARANLSGYTDQPSSWAKEAMQWAVAEGFISGVTKRELQPQGNATRAQVAAILQRFLAQ